MAATNSHPVFGKTVTVTEELSNVLTCGSSQFQIFRSGRPNQPAHLDWTWTYVRSEGSAHNKELIERLESLKMKASPNQHTELDGIVIDGYYARGPLGQTEVSTIVSVSDRAMATVQSEPTPVPVQSTLAVTPSTPVQSPTTTKVKLNGGIEYTLDQVLADLSLYKVQDLRSLVSILSQSDLLALQSASKAQKRSTRLDGDIAERLAKIAPIDDPTPVESPTPVPVQSGDINKMEHKLSSLESALHNSNQRIVALQSQVTEMEGQIKHYETAVDSLSARLDERINKILADLKTKFGEIDGDIDRILSGEF